MVKSSCFQKILKITEEKKNKLELQKYIIKNIIYVVLIIFVILIFYFVIHFFTFLTFLVCKCIDSMFYLIIYLLKKTSLNKKIKGIELKKN